MKTHIKSIISFFFVIILLFNFNFFKNINFTINIKDVKV